VSKIVDWGHWVVFAILAICGFAFFTDRIISDVAEAFYGRTTLTPVYVKFLWSIPFFMCAWGILKWNSWARGLAIVLSMAELVAFEVAGTTGIRHRPGWSALLAIILAGTPLIWTVLPSVRAEYMRRNRIA
jgi:hypothetical protein